MINGWTMSGPCLVFHFSTLDGWTLSRGYKADGTSIDSEERLATLSGRLSQRLLVLAKFGVCSSG